MNGRGTSRLFMALGACFGGLGVAFGALGAHSLKTLLTPDMLAVFEVGVRYQMYHALALLATGWAVDHFPEARFPLAGWLFTAGLLLFSGSLYVLALSGPRWLGALTPLGGLCLLGGWGVFAWQTWRKR